jgi:hypothetical protein
MMRGIVPAGFAFLLLAAPAAQAQESKLPPMDAAAQQDHLPDTVTPDGIHIGTWSASNPHAGVKAPAASPAANDSAMPDHLPDTVTPDGIHVGTWSANTPNAKPAPAPAASADGSDPALQSHTMTVTTLQTCYDQLDPAEVAEVKRNYLHPYAECQSRLDAKTEGKKELKQGEIQKSLTPDSPRNYIRVQQEPTAAAPANTENPPEKSGVKLNP